MEDSELRRRLEALESAMAQLGINNVSTLGGQSIFGGDVTILGQTEIRYPIIYALSAGAYPTDADACGVGMNAYGISFDGGLTYYQLFGFENGALTFGLRSTNGAALFMGGLGTIDANGINTTGVNYGLRQYATDPTDSTTKRYFRVEMLLPDGKTVPAGALTFTTGDVTNLITNGDAETGDLSNWTQSGTLWSASTDHYNSGLYSFLFSENTSTAETLTSDRYAASASKVYSINAWTKDYYQQTEVELEASADTHLISSQPTTNYGSEDSAVWAGYVPVPSKYHALIKFDYSSIPTNIYSVLSSKLHDFNYWGGSSGTQIYNAYRCLRAWVESEATWNIYSTGNNWGTAGAENTTTDRENSVVGTYTATTPGVYFDITLDNDLTKGMIDGTTTNNGFVIRGATESGASTKDGFALPREYTGGYDAPFLHQLTYLEASKYTVYIKFYDNLVAGNLIRTDTLFVENGNSAWNERTASVTAPAGSASYEIVISGGKGREFYIDDMVVAEQTFANKLMFVPELVYQDANGTRSVVTGKKELFVPRPPVAALKYTASLVQPGATTCPDTYINSGAATTNYGTANSVAVGESNAAAAIWRGLIKQDLTAYAAKTIIGSKMHLMVATDYSSNARTASVFRQLKAWTEAGATYNKYDGTNDWTVAGGFDAADCEQAAIGTCDYTAGETDGTWKIYTLDAAKVQELNDGTQSNYGYLVKMATESNDAYSHYSGNYATTTSRPKFETACADDGNLTNGAYTYKITFVDANGETTASAASNSVTVTDWYQQVDLTIQVGPQGTTSRKIYRTESGGSTYKYVGALSDNSTTTYTDNIADASLGAEPPTVNLTGSREQYPTYTIIPGYTVISNATLTNETSADWHTLYVSGGNAADGDWYQYPDFLLRGGTYTITFNGRKTTASGIVDWYLDNVEVVTAQDWYAGSAANATIQATSIAVVEDGTHTLKAITDGKHASSSDYAFEIAWISFHRTGD